jgi:hypothetical protein
MKKLIAIILFVFVYVTANAQQEIFVDELVGIKKPLTWDSTKKTINIIFIFFFFLFFFNHN